MKLTAATNGDRRYFSAKLGWREHFDPREMEMLAAGAVPMLIWARRLKVSKKLYMNATSSANAMGGINADAMPMATAISTSERPRFIYP